MKDMNTISEEVVKVLRSIKDQEHADLIRMYLEDPSYLTLRLIFEKLGIHIQSGRVNLIINVTHNYEERGILHQLIGAFIVDGLMYVLQLTYNPNFNEARIELIQYDYIVLQHYSLGDHNEKLEGQY